MGGKTVTRADLCEAVYQKVGLSRSESAELVESVLREIADCLVTGETVKLSSFGTFSVRSKTERIGRNPKTGEEVPILPRRVLVFKPSNVLKRKSTAGMLHRLKPTTERQLAGSCPPTNSVEIQFISRRSSRCCEIGLGFFRLSLL